jgi:hypothetical protein
MRQTSRKVEPGSLDLLTSKPVWTRRRLLQTGLALGLSAAWPAVGYSPRASLQSLHNALSTLRSQRLPLPLLEGFTEYRGVIHAHTGLSHDSRGTFDEILAAAHTARLNFLMTTDHYSPKIYTEGIEGLRDSVLILRGLEVGMGCIQASGIDRRCGAVLALGLVEPLTIDEQKGWDWDALFANIRKQGGLTIIAHSRGMLNADYFAKADGMEIYDVADAMRERIVDIPRHLVQFAMGFEQYPEEFLVPLVERMNWNLVQWDRMLQNRRFVGIAGNDAHQRLSILGRQLDRYDLVFRALNMHLLAAALTKEHLITALREGRCFASFNLLADAGGFQFTAQELSTGRRKAVLGEELAMQEDLVLDVQSPIPAAIVLMRDGIPVRREESRTMRHAVDRPGVYRVEVFLYVVDRWRPWIFSNPIYIRSEPQR